MTMPTVRIQVLWFTLRNSKCGMERAASEVKKLPVQEVCKRSRGVVELDDFTVDSFKRILSDSHFLVSMPLCDPLPLTMGWIQRLPCRGEDAVEVIGSRFRDQVASILGVLSPSLDLLGTCSLTLRAASCYIMSISMEPLQKELMSLASRQ